ncbi:MAG: hypothetical protein QM635_10930 [Microbacteriaceae bacterium]
MPDAESNPAVRAEHRWPAIVALGVALALYGLLPSSFLPLLRLIVVVIGAVLVVPLVIVNPVRLNRETRLSRTLSIAEDLVLLAANQVALVQLIALLVNGSTEQGQLILLAALQVWVTNIIAFALVYWEIDRGGPVARTQTPRTRLPPADFRFPQDEDRDAGAEASARSSAASGQTTSGQRASGWTASFVDYLYLSLSTSMAFSPTDAMPLSPRAKLLMGLQALAGFVILALVIARAVNLVG